MGSKEHTESINAMSMAADAILIQCRIWLTFSRWQDENQGSLNIKDFTTLCFERYVTRFEPLQIAGGDLARKNFLPVLFICLF